MKQCLPNCICWMITPERTAMKDLTFHYNLYMCIYKTALVFDSETPNILCKEFNPQALYCIIESVAYDKKLNVFLKKNWIWVNKALHFPKPYIFTWYLSKHNFVENLQFYSCTEIYFNAECVSYVKQDRTLFKLKA